MARLVARKEKKKGKQALRSLCSSSRDEVFAGLRKEDTKTHANTQTEGRREEKRWQFAAGSFSILLGKTISISG